MKGNETKHSKAFCASKLKSGETVIGHLEGWVGEMMGSGDKTQHNGQFILTNMRVCFYRNGFLGEIFETIPLEKITSIETLSRMGYRVIREQKGPGSHCFQNTTHTPPKFLSTHPALTIARSVPAFPSAVNAPQSAR